MKNRPVVIWDIDGVLADDRVRAQAFLAATDQFVIERSLALRENPDWDGYYGDMENDKPHSDMVDLFDFLHNHPSDPCFGVTDREGGFIEALPVFLTGRDDRYRDATVAWLRKEVHPMAATRYSPLYMRRNGSRLTNAEEKRHHLKEIRREHGIPIMAFEDNDGSAQFYREEGIRCLQVARAIPNGKAYKA